MASQADTPDINLFDPGVQQCPYQAYATLREQAPVYHCPYSGMYIVTRFEDVRRVLTDYDNFSNKTAFFSEERKTSPREQRVIDLFESEGWLPAPTLAGRDDPDHAAMRAVFNTAFRPGKIAELDDEVRDLAYSLIDDFLDDGYCDWVSQFAVPLPLFIIGRQMGADMDDIWRIKAWTEAFFHRISLMQSEEDELASVRK